ncbi:hypothetical protein BASA50_006410 [Batrachochytrium salamandrivorans]|uniref:PH domain-containing protein n=1 Tax=Batrachochytrium salamandrivorans TaxID=1357716 RepID=A0ABQ8FA62_9FUNG|nr:hypothetical protein BASA60_007968 [Batrachochytrium salamandrivorans]KAH6594735.1 hypothetical protein BASA50_006410 [Batrachochytrium salamandrivorans]KAH9250770.1 hypothetical protein BASA81_011424 [Batrachochytrium salamandrivorans]KAH9276658.1 hypothetical protein BASA83_000790 [Batrachochytrium salamandrivorans]KAJ1332823.1 hypothetical protein BSLG_008452 [Batrachochytrium salamandrivorans]
MPAAEDTAPPSMSPSMPSSQSAPTVLPPSRLQVVEYPFSDADDSGSDDQLPPMPLSPVQLSSPTPTAASPNNSNGSAYLGQASPNSLEKEHIIMSGYLLKKGEQRRSWKRRWFVLRPGMLSYYQNDKEYEILNLISLADVTTIAQVDLRRRPFVFAMVTRKRTYYVSASSLPDRDTWMDAIRKAHRSVRRSLSATAPSSLRAVSRPHIGHQVTFSLPSAHSPEIASPLSCHIPFSSDVDAIQSSRVGSPLTCHSDVPSIPESVATTESVLTISSSPLFDAADTPTAFRHLLFENPSTTMPLAAAATSSQIELNSSSRWFASANTSELVSTLSINAIQPTLPASLSDPLLSQHHLLLSQSTSESDRPLPLLSHSNTSHHSNTSVSNFDGNSEVHNYDSILSTSAPSHLSSQLHGSRQASALNQSGSRSPASPSTSLYDDVVVRQNRHLFHHGNYRSMSDPQLVRPDDDGDVHPPGFSDYDDDEDGPGGILHSEGSRLAERVRVENAVDDLGPLAHLTLGQRVLYRPALAAMANDQVVRQGYLLKLGGGLPRQWKRRWFVLRNGHLTCYKTDSEYEVLRIISLSSMIDVLSTDPPKGRSRYMHCFKVVLAKRSMLLCAESAEVAADWIGTFQTALQHVR